jgi:hypothetical protein
MPRFNITTSAPARYYWYYEVEANTKEEAERMVLDGEVDPDSYEVEDDPFEGSYYSVDGEEEEEKVK